MFDVKLITTPRAFDCGPTCLAMLLDYYDKEADLDALIVECKTRIVGCSAADLVRVGNAHGLEMKSYKMDAEELIRQDRPAIIWWKYNHFCVFAGLDEDGRVVICNPDRGKYRMSKGIFKSFYTEVALFNGEPGDLTD